MTPVRSGIIVPCLLSLVAGVAVGCGGDPGEAGLRVDIDFAAGVPRSARDEAARVEVYLVDSCDEVDVGSRPANAIASTYVLRSGEAGAPMDVPDPGQYGLYAVAQDATCAVVALGCSTVTIEVGNSDSYTVTLTPFAGAGCPADEQCLVDSGECSGGGTGGAPGAGGTGGDCAGGDLDDDGYCADTDCDDTVESCNLDCVTNSDGGAHVDCFEVFCGSDPKNSGSECFEVNNETDYRSAIENANDNGGPDHIVLHDITITTTPPAIDDNGGLTIRQVAGATVTVLSNTDYVFQLTSANNLIDGVRVVSVSNPEDIVEIAANNNTVQNCELEGFEQRGIHVKDANNAQLVHNTITGGTAQQGDETAAIRIEGSNGIVVAGNTVVLNAMDGLRIEKSSGPVIDHNTIADNGGSGVEFAADSVTGVCARNNNITGNSDFGLSATTNVSFNTGSGCGAPLPSGPAYGNNDFGNARGACGGGSCAGCSCLPPGVFWETDLDPGYVSISPGTPQFYCLDPSSSLVDGGSDLSYDLNDEAPGNFNGNGPDIGAREDGPGDCH